MQTHLNGDVVQDGTTADLIFDIPTLIAHVSSVMTLLPGDVILTGTPEGVGPMEVGDEVEVSIEGLGSLTNMVAHPMTTSTASGSGSPRPTGSPHVGLARTALFNWAFARHHGGTFVFRIEDTDHARNTQESYDGADRGHAVARPRLGRGPGQGRRVRPYRQSERSDIYTDVLAQLRGSRFTYDCYCTTEEVDARRKASGSKVHGLRRLLPRAHQRAGRGLRGGGPQARRPVPDARRLDHLGRPGARRDHLRDRSTCRTSRSAAPTASRSTRWSTRSTTR